MLARNSTSLSREVCESFGAKPSKTPSARLVGRARVHVPVVLAAPEEGLALEALDVADVDAVSAEHCEVLLLEVAADRTDDPHVVEHARREGEMDGRSAEHPVTLAERRLDGVKGN